MRPVAIIKRDIIAKLNVDVKMVKRGWENPYIQETLLKHGFKEGEEYFLAYKTYTDDYVFCGVEREADRIGSSNEGDAKPKAGVSK